MTPHSDTTPSQGCHILLNVKPRFKPNVFHAVEAAFPCFQSCMSEIRMSEQHAHRHDLVLLQHSQNERERVPGILMRADSKTCLGSSDGLPITQEVQTLFLCKAAAKKSVSDMIIPATLNSLHPQSYQHGSTLQRQGHDICSYVRIKKSNPSHVFSFSPAHSKDLS